MKKIFKIIIPITIVLLIISGIVIISNKNKQNIKDYKIVKAQIGNFSDYVAADGKVSGENQISIKPKITGNIDQILVKNGDKVKKGDLLVKFDTTDIEKTVQNAQIAVANSKNNLDKITKPVDSLAKIQAELSLQSAKDNLEKLKLSQTITLQQAKDARDNATTALDNSYDSALNNIDSSFAGFATIINDAQKILYLTDTIQNQDITGNSTTDANLLKDPLSLWSGEMPKYWNDSINSITFDTPEDKQKAQDLAISATSAYKSAKSLYDQNVITYRTLSKYSDKQTIENFLPTAIDTAKSISESMRAMNNLYDYWITYNNDRKRTLYYNIPVYNVTLKTDTSSSSEYLTNLISAQTGVYGINTLKTSLNDAQNNLDTLIQNQPLDLSSAQTSLQAQQEAYDKLISGADKLDIKSYQIALQQANVSLATATDQLANYYIKSPFDGVVGGITIRESDLVAAGTPIVNIISDNKIVEININENDTAKIQVGQKAIITFDAFDGLQINGEVAEIDSTPSIDQTNVVNYKIKISLKNDTDQSKKYFDLIKTGMNSSAKIITKEKNNILLVDSGAINQNDSGYYVETVKTYSNGKDEISQKSVQIGLVGTDNTEIISGIDNGQNVIIRQKKKLNTGMSFAN